MSRLNLFIVAMQGLNLNIRENTEHVTECCTGMTKNSAYITINNGLQRLNHAYMREDNTYERESNGHKPK